MAATLTFNKNTNIMEVGIDATEITIQEIVNQVRIFENDLTPQGGMDIPHILSAAGKQPLGGTDMVGVTITLIDWKIKFADRTSWITCNIRGGNIVAYNTATQSYVVPVEPAAYVNTNITASSSATLTGVTGLTETENQQLMKTLTVGKFLGLK